MQMFDPGMAGMPWVQNEAQREDMLTWLYFSFSLISTIVGYYWLVGYSDNVLSFTIQLIGVSLWTTILMLWLTLSSSPREDDMIVSPSASFHSDSPSNHHSPNSQSTIQSNISTNTQSSIKKTHHTNKSVVYKYWLRMYLQFAYIIPIWFVSSFIVAFVQAIVHFIPKTPWSPSFQTRMRLKQSLGGCFYSVILFTLEFWPNSLYKVKFADNVDKEMVKQLRQQNTITMINHAESEFDWMSAFVLADSYMSIHNALALMKKSFAWIPGLGWVTYLHGNIALERSWDHDMPKLKKLMPKIAHEYPQPWSIGIYPEGTRQTPKKLKEAKEFAQSRGYVVLNNLLQPRVKGFRFLLHELKSSMRYVVDLTTYYSPKPPSLQRFLMQGRLQDCTYFYIRIFKVEEVPTSEEEADQWLRDRWTEKDKIIDDIKANKIQFEAMPRDPSTACGYYGAFCILTAIGLHLIYFSIFICVCWLVAALFPILIVMLERDDVEVENRQEKMRRLSDVGISALQIQAILQQEESKNPRLLMSENLNDTEWWRTIKSNLGASVTAISRPRALSEEGFDIVSDHEDNT